MAPSKAPSSWEDDEESTPPSSPPVIAVRRTKFDDEEDQDVVDDWENDENSEEEREKAKQAAAAKAKAEAEAKANHKSKSQRRAEKIEENMRKRQELLEGSSDEEEEDEAVKRARLRAMEKAADMRNAEDLFGGVGGISDKRGAKPVTVVDDEDPANAVDLSALKLFNPSKPQDFQKLRDTLVSLLTEHARKPQYALFLPEFCKQLCKELSSEQIKKVSSALTTLSNEKMKEEKAAEKGGKKSKAAKTKSILNANRNISTAADTMVYDDGGLDDGDFM